MSYPAGATDKGRTMSDSEEVIALVLGDSDEQDESPDCDDTVGAKRLVRHDDGTVTLEPVESKEEFERTARTTGCFRRGKEIRDPQTQEIIGYEMEAVSPLRPASGQ
jgi:hypothetical protein